MVWDSHKSGSLKSYTRHSHGLGVVIHVSATTRLPTKWMTILQVDSNKASLFKLLAKTFIESHTPPEGQLGLTTCEGQVLSVPDGDITFLVPCAQDEADGRRMLHIANAFQTGLHRTSN